LLNLASLIVAGVLLAIIALSAPATGASTRHHHRRHSRGHRQEPQTGAETAAGSNSTATATRPWPSNCSHCGARQAKKDYRLASIRNEILRKLHLRAPPNITRGRQLPDIPPLRDLIGDDMVSDAPSSSNDNDDYHATTVKMMIFPISGMTDMTPQSTESIAEPYRTVHIAPFRSVLRSPCGTPLISSSPTIRSDSLVTRGAIIINLHLID